MTNRMVTLAEFRLTGTKEQIQHSLSFLRSKGCTWSSPGQYDPQKGETTKFAYYLNNLQVPQLETAEDKLQPQPGDMVLGSQNQP
jgi:hypothetical protein